MEIYFYGSAILGGLYTARVHEAGQEVAILARGQRLLGLAGDLNEDLPTSP